MPHCLPSSLTNIEVSATLPMSDTIEEAIGEESMDNFLQMRQLRSFEATRSLGLALCDRSYAKSSPFPDSVKRLHTTSLKVMRGQSGLGALKLPPYLETLTVDKVSMDEKTMKEVLRPIETLRSLSCPTVASEADALFWLPTRLVSLTYNADIVTDAHLYALPRSLEVLELYSHSEMHVKLTRPDLAQLFPPLLWKLAIPKTNLFPSGWSVASADHEQYAFVLPKTLRYLLVDWSSPSWWTSSVK